MLENIHDNIAKLISLYEAQKHRCEALEAKLSEAEAEKLRYREQITDLNHRIDNLTLSSAFGNRSDAAEAKLALDGLIREIDKCIKLLEK